MIKYLLLSSTLAQAFVGGPSGWPGLPHRSAPAFKQAIGTAHEPTGAISPVWFTVTEGALSEVFYPHVDQPQIGSLEFIVTDGTYFFSEQKMSPISQSVSTVQFREDMTVRIQGENSLLGYSFEQTVVTDVDSPTVRVHTDFQWRKPGFRVFIYLKPIVDQMAGKNLGWIQRDGLYATRVGYHGQPPTHLALLSSAPWTRGAAGYFGISDGWQQLFNHFMLTTPNWNTVGPGNIALTGEVEVPPGSTFSLDLALSFATNSTLARLQAQTSLRFPFSEIQSRYEASWNHYLDHLQEHASLSRLALLERPFTRKSTVLIKMHEDKIHRGAIVAALGTPTSSPSPQVRPRDLYSAALALLAIGDRETPIAAFRYLARNQLKSGAWPMHMGTDGTAESASKSESILELDQVAVPILLAHHLVHHYRYSLTPEEVETLRRATVFLIRHGPRTPRDRWGKEGGLISSTLAVVIAGLKSASSLIHDPAPEIIAQEWQTSLEKWTLGKQTPFQRGYYLGETLENGFFQLVRMGIRSPRDPRVLHTLNTLKALQRLPDSPLESLSLLDRRYLDSESLAAADGYWPVLTAARGFYAVADRNFEQARQVLKTLEQNATTNGFIPEQLSAPHRIRLGVACPSVWGHAEYILLHRSLQEGTLFDAPKNSSTPYFSQ